MKTTTNESQSQPDTLSYKKKKLVKVKPFFCQVFDSKESLSTAAECVKVAKEHCQQLTGIGLDLTFTLQSLLVKDVKAALQSQKDIIIEATKHRNSEEMWRRMNLMTPEALAKLKVSLASRLCLDLTFSFLWFKAEFPSYSFTLLMSWFDTDSNSEVTVFVLFSAG